MAVAIAVQSTCAVPAAGLPMVSAGISAGAFAVIWHGPSVSPLARAASKPCGKLTIVV